MSESLLLRCLNFLKDALSSNRHERACGALLSRISGLPNGAPSKSSEESSMR